MQTEVALSIKLEKRTSGCQEVNSEMNKNSTTLPQHKRTSYVQCILYLIVHYIQFHINLQVFKHLQ